MTRCLLLLSLLVISHASSGQVFSNLDFEYGVYKDQPRKWAIEGEGDAYSARLDSLQRKSGRKSLYVTQANAQVFVFLAIPGGRVGGKDIKVEGFFKSLSGDSLQAMLVFHNPNGGRPNASPPVNKKVGEWVSLSHQASIPADYSSDRLLIALMTQGTGRFWLDEVTITIGGELYGNGAPDFREPTKKEIQLLDKQAIPIKALDANAPADDLSLLKGIVGNARIVALGENSHGSASIYKLKLRMIKYLVEREGFSVFALESPAVEADRINEYVLSGNGSMDRVLKDLVYPSWQTQEMIDIVQWMRVHNQKAKIKVAFRGFDMQNGAPALKAVGDFARANDPNLAANVLELETLYKAPAKDDQQWKAVVMKAEEITSYLTARTFAGIDPTVSHGITHYMEMFQQSLPSEKARSRDQCMAENIEWLMKNSGDNARIIVSADNTHITKASGKMGSFLRAAFGDQYLAVGFTFNKGSYAAYGKEKFYEVHPSFGGTYEYYFSKSNFKNFFLDIRKMGDHSIISQPAGFRSIGSRPQETTQFVDINLREHFDAIAYLENSVHTEPVIKQDH